MAYGSSRRTVPQQLTLYTAVDSGPPIKLSPQPFAPSQRGGGWGTFADSFLRFNEEALSAVDVTAEARSDSSGFTLQLRPGGRTGAIPLRSGQTGNVAGGLVVQPRFGWSGVGRVLAETGWPALPEFHELPMVPGSGREVPPWVLAGPVLLRLGALLSQMRRGYQECEETLTRPRGRILWRRYISESLTQGHWEQLPCRFPDLGHDTLLRQHIRWALERLRTDLIRVGQADLVAVSLAQLSQRLLATLAGVTPRCPRRHDLERWARVGLLDGATYRGLEALAWVEEERGLGGGRELDGLAWSLSLSGLWEAYVEGVARREAALTGGEVRVARLGETTVPLAWSDPMHRSLGHLAPDIIVRRGRWVHIMDAKYKAHLAELDHVGWRRFAEETRAAHRADLHQILAYASLYEAEEITATLVYPLRHETWVTLARQHRDRASAELVHGGRRVLLVLRGLPFGTRT
ncbi:MAG TPA: hypothetical protein DCL63_04345 [Firmicutes bacterium]|nr:hypothetical protein [Bacillota bacterium]